MKKLMLVVAMLAVMVMVKPAHAIEFPAIVLTDFNVAVGVILTAIGGLWIARKLIKLGNRS